MSFLSLHSPVGDLTLFEEAGALVAVEWGWAGAGDPSPLLGRAKLLLDRYFDGEDVAFDLPMAPPGSPFETAVWDAMTRIPYGATRSYGAIAAALGSAAQAVGNACGANPIPILIPCHRVIAADGSLGGYSGDGGVETKTQLLRLEGALML